MSKHTKIIRQTAVAAIIAMAVTAVSYFLTNLPYSFTGEADIAAKAYTVLDVLTGNDDDEVPDSILLINTFYDRELATVVDEYTDTIGNIDVVDRRKLYSLLSQLKQVDNYRYIILDVDFKKGYYTETDDSLFDLIATMERLVVSRHKSSTLATEKLEPVARYADAYRSMGEVEISKEPLFVNHSDTATLPMAVYLALGGDSIKGRWPLAYSQGHLARRVIYPRMYVVVNEVYSTVDNFREPSYTNLGSVLRDWDMDIACKDKIVVIGAMTEADIHGTVRGDMPGSVVLLNTYISLCKGTQLVPWWYIGLLWLFFTLIVYQLIYGARKNPAEFTSRHLRHRRGAMALSVALLWTYYSIALMIFSTVMFIFTGQMCDVFYTSTLLTIAAWSMAIYNKRKQSRK